MKKSLIYTAIVLMITASLSAEANFGWNQEATGPGPKEKYEFSINDKDIIEAFTKKDQDIINIDNITTPAKMVKVSKLTIKKPWSITRRQKKP